MRCSFGTKVNGSLELDSMYLPIVVGVAEGAQHVLENSSETNEVIGERFGASLSRIPQSSLVGKNPSKTKETLNGQ